MNKDDYQRENWLKAHGWNVNTNEIASNAGSETIKHYLAKCIVVHYFRNKGIRVTTEAQHGDRGTVDVLVHGPPDGAPYAVELESSPTEETKQQKIKQYIENSPLREMYWINVSAMPMDIVEAYEYVSEQLP